MENQFVPTDDVVTARMQEIHDGADDVKPVDIALTSDGKNACISENWGISDRMNRWIDGTPVVWSSSQALFAPVFQVTLLDLMIDHPYINN